jgi:N-acyl-phosphatidylethanolamine-hydrolysing phospholipase D
MGGLLAAARMRKMGCRGEKSRGRPGLQRQHRPSPGLSRRRVNRLIGLLPLALAAGTTETRGQPASSPDHHTAEGFRNPPGSQPQGGDVGDWASFFVRRFGPQDPVMVPVGHVLDPAKAAAGLGQLERSDTLTWLGHASFLIQLDGRRVLTDPFLADHASPLPPLGPKRFAGPGLTPAMLPRVDLLLISHNHYDHLDLPTIEALDGKDRIEVIVPLGLGHHFTSRGYSRVRELDWHDEVAVAGLRVRALPAIHFSKRGLFDRNQTLWCGYAIEGRTCRVHFAGDTGYGPVFTELGKDLRPFDLSLLPIGAYEPRLLMRAVHANPEEALQIGQQLRARRLVGMHWGTISLTDEPPFEPPQRFRTAASAAGHAEHDIWVMAIGETRPI